jgi:putative component of toxin-antitoxin plasmid stabilization module
MYAMAYNESMIDVVKSESFERWLLGLKDRVAVARIQARI